MTTSKYIVLDEAKFVSIKGRDNKDFLQGIITNDINKCNKKVIYSCLLTPQGKFLSDFFIIPFKDSFLIEINKKFFDDFITKLKLYKLRSRIDIEEINYLTSLIIINKSDDNTPKEGFIISDDEYVEYVDPRNINLGHRILIKNELVDKLINSDKFILTDIKEYQKIMIQNLIPNSINDLVINKSLLLENNFEHINALDWDKGCYIGQENTARMKYRALLKKSLRIIKVCSGTVKSGDQILLEDKNIGNITSIVEDMGLAMIKIEDANNAFKKNKVLKTDSASLKIIH